MSLKAPVGVGTVKLEWQTHDGTLWAATGSNRTVNIYDHFGNQKAMIAMPGYLFLDIYLVGVIFYNCFFLTGPAQGSAGIVKATSLQLLMIIVLFFTCGTQIALKLKRLKLV